MSKTKTGLSTFDFFTMGFGAIVGVGWAISINNWVASAGGPLPAIGGYLLTLILLIPIGLCYTELSAMMPVAGGNAAFAYKAFGEKISFLTGWAAVGAFITLLPWEAIYINEILGLLVPWLKSDAPLYHVLGYPIHPRALIVGLICTALLFIVNWKGSAIAAKLQNTLCVLLIGAGVLAIIAALSKANPANLMPAYENVGTGVHTSFMGGVLAILATSPFFMCGFETIPQAAEEASGSTKGIGKTVLMAIGCSIAFYVMLLLAFGLAMPWQDFVNLPNPAVTNMFNLLYNGVAGKMIGIIVLLGAVFGLLTTWNAFLTATPRLMMGLSRAGLIPGAFAKTHAKTGTPTVALVFCSLFAAAGPFLGTNVINILTSFASAGFVFCWFCTACSLICLRYKAPDMPRPYIIPGGMILPWFSALAAAVVFVLFLVPGSVCYIGNIGVIMLLVWFALGLALYLLTAGERRARPEEERVAAMFARISN